ncbi:unnamed protein product, partial [Adineta steineri]
LNPFQCSYRGRVLYHYPNEVLNNPFDEDAISRLSMPDGVSIRLNSPDPPTTHPFLITRLDGTRYYGVALTFYEQLNNNDDEIYTENSSSTAFISLNRLIENYNRTSRHQQRRSSSLIIYASKVICLIGPLAHYSTFKRILELLYRMTIEHDLLGLPFEAHLYNILHELHIPSPSLSHSVLKFNVGERQLTVWQPSINDDDLPLLDFNLLEFFSLLGVEGVIDLVTCALLEHQIILKSSDYTRLMLVAECLTALLFPFQWTLLYVPIVFTAALVCLDVPVPAIMGLRINKSNANKDNDNDGDNNADDDDDDGYSDTSDDANFEVQRCVVHIDTGRIQLPDDMPRFPDRSCFRSELHDILSRFDNYFNRDLTTVDYLKKQRRIQGSEDWTHVDNQQIKNESKDEPSQALTRLSAIAKRAGIVLNNNEDDNSNEPLCLFNEFEINQISANNCLRSSFVNRFAQLFSQMDAFICYPPSGKYANIDQWLAQRSTTKNFDRTMFIADQPKPHVPFLLAFMETQSFVSFVDSKIAARFNEDNLCFGLTHKHLQFFSDRIRLYRDRRDLTYQPCTSIDLIDNRTRLRFTSPFPSSLIIVNASIVRPLNTSISTSNNCYLFENLNGNILESSASVAVNISSPLSSGISKRNSRLTRSFQKNQSNQQADDIYELLGRSINQLVKYFDDPEKKRGLITPILCGEDGLVNALEKTLSYGLKKPTSNLSFFGGGRKRYVWDFLIKVCDEYDARRSQWQRSEREKAIICYINGVRSIEKALATFGKDGRFQSWCCFACKLHLLSDWFRLLSQCSDACLTQFYDPLNNCFRQKKLNQFINNILEPVKDFDFAHLEPALLKGLAGV